VVSPKSRGRPPGRGRPRQQGNRPAARRASPGPVAWTGDHFDLDDEETDCWFDEPVPADRRSWAIPPGHGTYRGIELERLDPDDEGELGILFEALHGEFHEALDSGDDMVIDGEPVNPRLHVAMHQVVARQLLSNDPPKAWSTVQRLAGLGYDWHNIMHMIAALVTEDVHAALTEHRRHDPASYARRLDQLPGDWPPPEELGQ
jgi:Domain of unknown function (DUF1841)